MSRKTFLRRVKKLSPHCRVVCVRVLADLRTCITHNQAETRVRFKEAVPEQLIREMDAAFEEVSITEGFDAIEIVSA